MCHQNSSLVYYGTLEGKETLGPRSSHVSKECQDTSSDVYYDHIVFASTLSHQSKATKFSLNQTIHCSWVSLDHVVLTLIVHLEGEIVGELVFLPHH